jgi:hypothetical protein
VNDRVLIESNCGHLIGEEGISIAAGIISYIDAHPAKLFQLDDQPQQGCRVLSDRFPTSSEDVLVLPRL